MRSKSLNNHGYTLIEIIIVIVILGVIGAFTFQMVAAGVQAFKKSSARKDLFDQGRLALERMVRELRDGKEITDCSSNSITFKKAHPAQAADNIEEVKFELVGTDLKRVGDPSGSPQTAVLASNVTSFQVGEEAGGSGSVTVDASSSGTAAAGATGITISSYTVAGSDRLMLVGVSIMNAAEDEPTDPPGEAVSSITWNGTNLTLVGSRITTDTDDGRIEIWKLVAPATGTGNVVVTFNRAITQEAVAGVVTFTGVDQSTPLGTFASNAGDNTTVGTLSVPSASGETVFGVICAEYESLTASSGQTEHWNAYFSSTAAAGGTKVATSSSVTMSWNLNPGTTNHWAIGGVSVKPSSSSGSTVCSAGGAISFDAYSTTTSSWQTSTSFSHTIGSGSNRLLVVGISIEHSASGPSVSSITYNGQALTKIDSRGITNDYYGRAELWYSLEANLPSAGTYTIVVNTPTAPEELIAGAMSLNGVAQQAPEAKGESSADYLDTISTTITTLTNGAWLVDAVHSGMEYGFTPNSGQTERYDRAGGASTSRLAASTKEVAVAGSATMGWTMSGANRMAHEVAAFAPVPASSPLVPLTLTLQDPQDNANSVTLRTKVYMRNMPQPDG
jgi:prepilin-type N-terminal cleavage/methylation domain-containing protein